jgi:hypothetical protein
MKVAGRQFWMWVSVWALSMFARGDSTLRAQVQSAPKSSIMSPRDPQITTDNGHKVNTHKVPRKGMATGSLGRHVGPVKKNTSQTTAADSPTESNKSGVTTEGFTIKQNSKVTPDYTRHKLNSSAHKVPGPKTPK